jgi:hypothetical protein
MQGAWASGHMPEFLACVHCLKVSFRVQNENDLLGDEGSERTLRVLSTLFAMASACAAAANALPALKLLMGVIRTASYAFPDLGPAFPEYLLHSSAVATWGQVLVSICALPDPDEAESGDDPAAVLLWKSKARVATIWSNLLRAALPGRRSTEGPLAPALAHTYGSLLALIHDPSSHYMLFFSCNPSLPAMSSFVPRYTALLSAAQTTLQTPRRALEPDSPGLAAFNKCRVSFLFCIAEVTCFLSLYC